MKTNQINQIADLETSRQDISKCLIPDLDQNDLHKLNSDLKWEEASKLESKCKSQAQLDRKADIVVLGGKTLAVAPWLDNIEKGLETPLNGTTILCGWVLLSGYMVYKFYLACFGWSNGLDTQKRGICPIKASTRSI